MNKIILEIEDDTLEDPVFLTGIVSQAPDYQLVQQINKHLGTQFVDSLSPFVNRNKKEESQYRLFYNPESEYTPEAFLINNQSFTESNRAFFDAHFQVAHKLFKSANKFDYFLICIAQSLANQLNNALLKKHIITYFQVDFESLNKFEFQILNSIIFKKYEQS